MRAPDHAGAKFGRLLAIRLTGGRINGGVAWKFLCDCGKDVELDLKRVSRGHTKSCGCLKSDAAKERHAKRRVSKVCADCGVGFQCRKSKEHSRKYCSKACMANAYRKNGLFAGPSNPRRVHSDPLEARRAWQRAYIAANKEKFSLHWRAMKAKRKGCIGRHSLRDLHRMRVRQGDCCATCGDRLFGKGHVDHIIPLAKGGTNFVGNLQLLCAMCNSTKSDLLPIVFRIRRLRKT